MGNLLGITDLDGLGPFTVNWEVALTQAFGVLTQTRATGNSYVVRATDRGLFIRANVTFTDAFGSPESRPSVAVRFPLLAVAPAGAAAAPATPVASPLGQALAPHDRAGVRPAGGGSARLDARRLAQHVGTDRGDRRAVGHEDGADLAVLA